MKVFKQFSWLAEEHVNSILITMLPDMNGEETEKESGLSDSFIIVLLYRGVVYNTFYNTEDNENIYCQLIHYH